MTIPSSGPVGGSSDTWEFLVDRVHRVLEIIAGLARKHYSPQGVGGGLGDLDAALSWSEDYLRVHGSGWPRSSDMDGPGLARDLLLEVVDLRGRLIATVMASRHETMQRVDQSLQRLRSVGTVEEFARELPKEIVGLGYVRSLFSWAEGIHWVAQSAHSVQGEEEGRRLVEAGRQRPYRDIRGLFEYEMLRERRPILRQGIRKSRQVHPELMRITESDSYVASPLIAGGAVVGFASLDVNATTGSVDGFDRDLVGIHTSGASIILERLRLDRFRSAPPERLDSEVGKTPADGLVPRAGETLGRLTAREEEILHLVAEGMTNADIGRELTISEGTAKTHVRNVLRKLEVSNRTQAAALYRRERGQ